ncbi:thiamine pyrophosphate-dependent enzyme, partial [Acinetobacter baumannii]
TLHATGLGMGLVFDGKCGTGDPERDEAEIVYYGDGASSQGDVHESMVFAASFQTPEVFFLQNNQWAISVPVATQSRTPLYKRA